ncbi:MAG: DNA mismatch repair protein MutS [Calditrichaeota bacterium]|nr:DNA mismatch repair protein MutS [Calditrichota bacterium]RQV92289.1 MAG: DNA mismatch repair protein MutS [bacterium]
MEQYLKIKSKHQDKILLYRMGDFYETFYEDARIISKILGIALTKRSHGKTSDVPLAGFPYHALESYLPKLIQAGKKVAICEQVEDPKLAKTVVKREVIEVVTPGTTMSDKLLDLKNNNFLAAVAIEGQDAGISYCDISTGEFYVSEVSLEQMLDYFHQISPKEILVTASHFDQFKQLFEKRVPSILSRLDDWIFSRSYAYESLVQHFRTPNLKGFGIEELNLGVTAAGAILHYVKENYQSKISHLNRISYLQLQEYMLLDSTTRRNLEITYSMLGERSEGTLISIIDHTITPMGGRLLRRWIHHPLTRLKSIEERLSRVNAFYEQTRVRKDFRKLLEEIADLERLIGRISTGRATPRDLIALKNSLLLVNPLKDILQSQADPMLFFFVEGLENVDDIIRLVESAIVDDPPLVLTDGGIIRKGYNEELDEYRTVSRDGKDWLVKIQQEEREKSGIAGLKLGYNKVFGYYFEVTRSHQAKVPDYFIRKQTLVNAERYITPELKEYEEKILGAEEKISELEYRLFQEVRDKIATYGKKIQRNAELIAELDCLSSLAEVAVRHNYVRPEMHEGDAINIVAGRHPVVEKLLPPSEPFIENDTELNNSDTQIMILTGPNMAGKSTYLRQVGLISLMAQIGSFVPARKASLSIVDRIFTRVGASDNLAFGESTFLVEMLETANILNNASPRSLVILDEIGRGTSTFDGLSLAWAVTEYLHNNKKMAAKTLFATHYHELTELELLYPKIKNYRVMVKEVEDSVIFLRKIERGGIDNSYGIHVAKMAGLPLEIIERAKEVLYNLEANEMSPNRVPRIAGRRSGSASDRNQLSLLELMKKSPVEEELEKMEINNITPLEALLKLNELKNMLKNS